MTALFAALFLSAGSVFAATNDLATLLQRGLLEEEATHNLEAAMRHYQAAIDGFDQDRQLAATAVFRLGECLRKVGKTNEATIQYERVLREFPDQTNLAKLSLDYLGGARSTNLAVGGPDAKLLQIQASYNEVMLKWILADREVATVTNLNKQEQENYFTTVKPDSALAECLRERSTAESEFNQARNLGYGPNHPTYLAAQTALMKVNDKAAQRVDALVRGVRIEAQLLHEQGDALSMLLDQTRAGLVAAAPGGGAAAPSSATSAEDEEVRKIREMIRNSPDLINAPDYSGAYTPLQYAIQSGNIAATELLLTNGAIVNGTGRSGDTPLSLAAVRGNKAMVELLLAKGADVNAADKDNLAHTPLSHAVQSGFKSVVEVLIAHKADVNARREHGYTPLHDAARHGFSAIAELLLANGANVNAADANGETPLFTAVQYNQPEMVQLLLSNKAGVNAVLNNGETALIRAVYDNRPEMVQLLLSNKAQVNFTNLAGETPLITAARNNRADMARLLLANKAEVNARDKSGYTALHWAVLDNRPDLVKLLLSNKADVNATTDIGVTPLLIAVARSDVDSSGDRQTGPRAPETPGVPSGIPVAAMPPMALRPPGSSPFPALGYAATNLVEILLENGADTQAHIKEGGGSWGPIVPGIHALDLAIENGRSDVMELLLDGHADPNARHTASGQRGRGSPAGGLSSEYAETPLLMCLRVNNMQNAELAKELKILLDHGADPNVADEYGMTPLAMVAESGRFPNLAEDMRVNMMQELLDHHADPNKPDDRGLPPLAYVTGRSETEIKAALLKAGANEDYQRLARIFMAQKGTGSLGQEVFYKGTNSVNHYTLLELIAEANKNLGFAPVPFPDFAHVVINRLSTNSTKAEINVNLDEFFASGDCSKDVPLEWGDVVQIPQSDHLLNEVSAPLPPKDWEALTKCLQRQVQIVVKGQTTKLRLLPGSANQATARQGEGSPDFMSRLEAIRAAGQPTTIERTPGANAGEKILYTFLLREVVQQANVLLLSSDLSRVKVTRHGVDMQYNLDELEARAGRRAGAGGRGGGGGGGPGVPMPPVPARIGGGGGGSASNNNSPDLWLRDGDVIEIPERDPNAPLVK